MSLNGEETTRRSLPSHVYSDLSQAVAALGHLINCYTSPGDAKLGPYVLGIEHRETAQLLGHVGFSPLAGEVEVSYAIAEGLAAGATRPRPWPRRASGPLEPLHCAGSLR